MQRWFAKCVPGTISTPIPVPGGVSILAVQDTRKILTRDPRDAVLSLKQVSIDFPKGTSRAVAEPMVARFAEAREDVGGCGGAEKIAAEFHAEIVQQDGVKMRDLPAALQQMMLPMQVGQATPPFGSLEEGVRVARRLRPRRSRPHGSELRRGLQPAQRGAGEQPRLDATCATCAATR